MALCPYCRSDHGPDEYAVGYFLIGLEDGKPKVVTVKGEGEVYRRMEKYLASSDPNALRGEPNPDFLGTHVFWNRDAVEAFLVSTLGQHLDSATKMTTAIGKERELIDKALKGV